MGSFFDFFSPIPIPFPLAIQIHPIFIPSFLLLPPFQLLFQSMNFQPLPPFPLPLLTLSPSILIPRIFSSPF